MYYFVGFNLGKNITGIEKAMINRMELFNANNSKAMCIFYHGIDLFQNILLALLK